MLTRVELRNRLQAFIDILNADPDVQYYLKLITFTSGGPNVDMLITDPLISQCMFKGYADVPINAVDFGPITDDGDDVYAETNVVLFRYLASAGGSDLQQTATYAILISVNSMTSVTKIHHFIQLDTPMTFDDDSDRLERRYRRTVKNCTE